MGLLFLTIKKHNNVSLWYKWTVITYDVRQYIELDVISLLALGTTHLNPVKLWKHFGQYLIHVPFLHLYGITCFALKATLIKVKFVLEPWCRGKANKIHYRSTKTLCAQWETNSSWAGGFGHWRSCHLSVKVLNRVWMVLNKDCLCIMNAEICFLPAYWLLCWPVCHNAFIRYALQLICYVLIVSS